MTSPFLSFVRAMPSASRRTRRVLVAVAFLGYPLLNVGYFGLVAPGRLSSVTWAPIAILLLGATLVGVVGIYGYVRGRADMKADLDERQVRDQAWIHAYEIVIVVVSVAVAALAIAASFSGPVTIGMTELTPVIISIALYLPLLPSATLTWSEADPPADLDDSGRGR